MKRILLLTSFSFLACGQVAPLDPDELAPFRVCAEASECVAAVNAPATCEGRAGDVVAINRSQADDFFDALGGSPDDCVHTTILPITPDARFVADRYRFECAMAQCTIAEEREAAGRACSEASPCPASYRCEAGDAFPNASWCLYVGTSTAT